MLALLVLSASFRKLRGSYMASEYQDPTLGANDVRVDTYSANVGREERTWYKPWTWDNSEYVVEKHSFNRFQDDEVPSLAIRRTEQHSTGLTQERSVDGKCWTEAQVETFEYVTKVYIKKRWIEWWRINKSLEAYYEFFSEKNATDLAGAVEAPIRHVARLSGQPSITPTTSIIGGAVGATATLVRMAPGMIAQGEMALASAGEMAAAAGAGGALPGLADAAAVGATELTGLATTGAGYGLSAVGSAASTVASVAVPAAVISGVAVISFVGTTEIMKKYVEAAEKISEGWEFIARYHGPEELVRQSLGWERVGPVRDCHPKKKKTESGTGWLPWWPLPWPWWVVVPIILVVLLAVAFWLWLGGGGDDAHVTTGSVTEVPVAASVTSSPVLGATATATPLIVTGTYTGSVTVGDDPAGHACCVKPTGTWTVLQTRNTQTNAITITLSDILPGIQLTGPVPASGQTFTATGSGSVAGYPNVGVSFTGTATAEAGLSGVLTVGGNGALPQGKAITFNVKMTKAP